MQYTRVHEFYPHCLNQSQRLHIGIRRHTVYRAHKYQNNIQTFGSNPETVPQPVQKVDKTTNQGDIYGGLTRGFLSLARLGCDIAFPKHQIGTNMCTSRNQLVTINRSHALIVPTTGIELTRHVRTTHVDEMSERKPLSCGRDLFCVPNLTEALDVGGKNGYGD